MSNVTKTFDYNLLLHDGDAITASAAGNISGTAKIADLGAGIVYGDIIVDVSALDVDTGNEIVTIGVQVSSSATFASDVYQLASLAIGDAAALTGDTDMTTGRYVIPFNNLIKNGTAKRYLRIYFTIAGTVASFDCVAYLSMRS